MSARMERVFEYALGKTLAQHEQGLETEVAYRLIDQRCRLPEEWRKPIPTSTGYSQLKRDGLRARDLTDQELSRRYPTEPKWKNRVRFTVRHFRDASWLSADANGRWNLTIAGQAAVEALTLSGYTRAELEILNESGLVGDPPPSEDDPSDKERCRVLREIAVRRGQRKMRNDLIDAYNATCAISGCDAVEALEAAHIVPSAEGGAPTPSNGLLLRADIHTLFDLGLLGIDPDDRAIHVSTRLAATTYAELEGRDLRAPRDTHSAPALPALQWRWRYFMPDKV